MAETLRLRLPLLAAGQAQKEITHNEALTGLDGIVHVAALSRQLAAPPSTAAPGDIHIVPAAGVAAWGAPADTLMCWDGQGWRQIVPVPGMTAYVVSEAAMLVYMTGWQTGWPVARLAIAGRSVLGAVPATIVPPAGGAVVDAEARAVLGALLLALAAQGLIS